MVLYKNLEMDKQALLGPEPLTMERFSTAENMVISQSTSLFCRPCCLQPSINFSATDHATNVSTNDAAARRDAKNSASGWFHEESTLLGRTCSSCFPGGRAVKYVYHSGPIPQALQSDDATCCTLNVQSEATSDEFNAVNPNDLGKVEFYHEKKVRRATHTRELATHTRELATHTRELATHTRELATHTCEQSSHNPHV